MGKSRASENLIYFEAVTIDLSVQPQNSMRFRFKCLFNPCDCTSGPSPTRWKQSTATECVNQFQTETAITAQPGGLMHIMASSDLPVPLTCAGLNSGVIMALHANFERARSKIATCFPSTIQPLLCRLAYIHYSNMQLIRKKIMSFDSVTYSTNMELLLVCSLTTTTFSLQLWTWQYAVHGPEGGQQWRLPVRTVQYWNCLVLRPEPPTVAPNLLEWKMWFFNISVYRYFKINIKILIGDRWIKMTQIFIQIQLPSASFLQRPPTLTTSAQRILCRLFKATSKGEQNERVPGP